MPPLWPDHENFLQVTLYEKVCFFAIFQQELQNSTMFDGLFKIFFILIQYAIKIAT